MVSPVARAIVRSSGRGSPRAAQLVAGFRVGGSRQGRSAGVQRKFGGGWACGAGGGCMVGQQHVTDGPGGVWKGHLDTWRDRGPSPVFPASLLSLGTGVLTGKHLNFAVISEGPVTRFPESAPKGLPIRSPPGWACRLRTAVLGERGPRREGSPGALMRLVHSPLRRLALLHPSVTSANEGADATKSHLLPGPGRGGGRRRGSRLAGHFTVLAR